MVEAKWWPKGQAPSEPGSYLQKIGSSIFAARFPDTKIFSADSQFFGPIPDPPKEPPTLRRFTAKHLRYGNVAGFAIPARTHSQKPFFISYWSGDLADWAWIDECEIVAGSIQWLDPVC